MTTNFPSSIDNFTNPTTSDTLASVSHSAQHADVNDAVEAIETALLDGAPLHIDDANEHVGIGTTTPDRGLHVDSPTAAVSAKFTSQHPTLGLIEVEGGASTSTAQVGVDGDDIVFRPLQAERMRIDSPLKPVQVSGRIKATGISGNSFPLELNTNTTSCRIIMKDANSTSSVVVGSETNDLIIRTNNNERMRIDSEGNLTTPTSSWFHARLSATVSSWNSNNQTLAVPYDSVVRNIGNDYSGSTGLYTVPVAGRYCFTASLYTTSGSSSLEQWWFVINGSRAETPIIGGNGNIKGGTGVIYLGAGDSVGVHFWAGGIGNINLQASSLHTFFMGGLIS